MTTHQFQAVPYDILIYNEACRNLRSEAVREGGSNGLMREGQGEIGAQRKVGGRQQSVTIKVSTIC